MLRRIRVLVVLASIVGALTVGAAGASAANWAGLGDSYAAGPLIPSQQLNPLGCLRSDHNFAHLAAATLGRSLADASCSGAKTDDMTAPQEVTPGSNPPQFNALTTDTQIVTLQIGGNDIGFSEHPAELRHREPVRAPVPRPLRGQRLTTRSPTRSPPPRRRWPPSCRGSTPARPRRCVFVVNYAAILPETGSRLLAAGPDRVLRRQLPAHRGRRNLNAMLAQQAAANGARIVDDYTREHRPRRVQVALDALGRAARPRQPGGPLPPQRARGGGRSGGAGQRGVELASARPTVPTKGRLTTTSRDGWREFASPPAAVLLFGRRTTTRQDTLAPNDPRSPTARCAPTRPR